MKPRRVMLRAAALAALLAPGAHAAMTAVPELGLEVADGFRVTVFAGPELADDIQAMTFDARERVVVTGPGGRRPGESLADEVGRGTLGREQQEAAVLDEELEPLAALMGAPGKPAVAILERVTRRPPHPQATGWPARPTT